MASFVLSPVSHPLLEGLPLVAGHLLVAVALAAIPQQRIEIAPSASDAVCRRFGGATPAVRLAGFGRFRCLRIPSAFGESVHRLAHHNPVFGYPPGGRGQRILKPDKQISRIFVGLAVRWSVWAGQRVDVAKETMGFRVVVRVTALGSVVREDHSVALEREWRWRLRSNRNGPREYSVGLGGRAATPSRLIPPKPTPRPASPARPHDSGESGSSSWDSERSWP
jgi:hypothetical protein